MIVEDDLGDRSSAKPGRRTSGWRAPYMPFSERHFIRATRKKKKWPRGRRNPLKRFSSDKGIKVNSRGFPLILFDWPWPDLARLGKFWGFAWKSLAGEPLRIGLYTGYSSVIASA
jgi:hypothetical protein